MSTYTARYERLAVDDGDSAAPRGRPVGGIVTRIIARLREVGKELERRDKRYFLLFGALLVFLIIMLPTLGLLATPDPASQAASDASIRLAIKFAPRFVFAKDEKFGPSTIDWFLSNDILPVDSQNRSVPTTRPLTAANLDQLQDGTFLSVPADVLAAPAEGFLSGQHDFNDVRVYAMIAKKPRGITDIFYWMFCPYNLAKSVPIPPFNGKVLGNHVGDWERVRVRTVHGTAVSVDYHAHEGTGSGTIPWARAETFVGGSRLTKRLGFGSSGARRPVAYVASGSHGFWARAGSFVFIDAHAGDRSAFQSTDETGGGVSWDSRHSLVVIDIGLPAMPKWLQFSGYWGNPGDKSCPWYQILPICETSDAPNGPLRPSVLTGPPMHTLATPSTAGISKLTMHVLTTAAWLRVQILCEAGSDGNALHDITRVSVDFEKQKFEIEKPPKPTAIESAPIQMEGGKTKVKTNVAACKPGSAVIGYSVGVCASAVDNECRYAEPRKLRVYASFEEEGPADRGVKAVRSVELDDMDVWEL